MERSEIRGRDMARKIVPGFRFAQPGLRSLQQASRCQCEPECSDAAGCSDNDAEVGEPANHRSCSRHDPQFAGGAQFIPGPSAAARRRRYADATGSFRRRDARIAATREI